MQCILRPTTIIDGEHLDTYKANSTRIVLQASDLAVREQTALVISDAHPNIVRYVALAADSDYQYLALELYQRSLADLLAGPGAHASLKDDAGRPSVTFFQASNEL